MLNRWLVKEVARRLKQENNYDFNNSGDDYENREAIAIADNR
jgi:hypothetical protein